MNQTLACCAIDGSVHLGWTHENYNGARIAVTLSLCEGSSLSSRDQRREFNHTPHIQCYIYSFSLFNICFTVVKGTMYCGINALCMSAVNKVISDTQAEKGHDT